MYGPNILYSIYAWRILLIKIFELYWRQKSTLIDIKKKKK